MPIDRRSKVKFVKIFSSRRKRKWNTTWIRNLKLNEIQMVVENMLPNSEKAKIPGA
jgi:hypothetical protein